MARRRFLAQMATWPLAALVPITTFPEPRSASLKIVFKSARGSDDPTKAAKRSSERPDTVLDFVQLWRRYAMGHA